MRYLPYAQEQTWGQTYGYNPGVYINPNDFPAEDLPMTYQLGNSFFSNVDNGNYGRAAADIVFLPFTEVVDAAGNMLNTAYNGYKRAYNYGANTYNNLADYYNNWQSNRHMNSIPTRLTGRKITTGINPALYNPTLAEVEKPIRYLANDGQPVAKIIDPNPYQIKVVPAVSGSIQLPTARDFSNARKMAVYNGYLR